MQRMSGSDPLASSRSDIDRAAADPNRPTYHLLPPAGWINDTNGAIWHDGWYHIFYLHSPGQDKPFAADPKWRTKVWGHARSRDLVRWQNLPTALTPPDPTFRCMSGSTYVRSDRQPLIFYSYSPIVPGPVCQCLALGDHELLNWTHYEGGSILDLADHDGPDFEPDWRDPYIFACQDRHFLILGAILDGEAVIPIYEAKDRTLTEWRYRGIFLKLPRSDIRFFECPKFFRVGSEWILVISPFGPVQYFSSRFDLDRLVFEPHHSGIVDHGDCFYAAEDLSDPSGSQVLFGWIPGWNSEYHIGVGWNGMVSLPRILSLSDKGELLQQPLPALATLRAEQTSLVDLTLDNQVHRLHEIEGDALEIKICFEATQATRYGIQVRLAEHKDEAVEIRIEEETLIVCDRTVSIGPDSRDQLTLHLFLDRCVLEIFVNDGRFCLTHLFSARPEDLGLALFASGGSVRIRSLDIWKLRYQAL
jgi:beta-fructofuranosidase